MNEQDLGKLLAVAKEVQTHATALLQVMEASKEIPGRATVLLLSLEKFDRALTRTEQIHASSMRAEENLENKADLFPDESQPPPDMPKGME